MEFPAGLPCPMIDGYGLEINNGLSAVMFEHGNTRQRRNVTEDRTVVTMSFTLSTAQLWEWQSWANKSGYSWHYMNLYTQYSGYLDRTMVRHRLRYLGDISIVPQEADHFVVTIAAELDMDYAVEGVVKRSGLWIIARTPANPSSPDWYIAGTPASPSFYAVTAGYPGNTAA